MKCEELKARAAGLYVSRTEDITETRSLGELLADAEKEFGEEAAQAIKVALGLARPEKAKLKAVP